MSGGAPPSVPGLRSVSRGYWLLAAALALYVALCTGARENHPKTDAWEHHRAILALAREGPGAGNPTYDDPAPSIRYSPFTVVLAGVSRATGAPVAPRDVVLAEPATAWSVPSVSGRIVFALHPSTHSSPTRPPIGARSSHAGTCAGSCSTRRAKTPPRSRACETRARS